MRISLRLLLWAAFLWQSATAGTIVVQISELGPSGSGESLHRFTYTLDGIALQRNQELDVRFDAALFGKLSNALAPGGFDVLLFQPNNPPGAAGDFSALALVDNAASGPFSVDLLLLGTSLPGGQPFFINQYDPSGKFISTIASGVTTIAVDDDSPVPEPGYSALAGAQLLIGAIFIAVRSRWR